MDAVRLCFLISLAVSAPALAQPDLRLRRTAGEMIVFPDDAKPGLYYYPPGEIAVATDSDGRPELNFLQTRYTGTAASADRGTVLFRSVLTFNVKMAGPSTSQLRNAREALARAAGRAIELRPLPIRRLEAALVYTGTELSNETASATPLQGGHFEADVEGSAGAYWRERTYTLGLDNAASQLFWAALHEGQLVISLGYAFFADGIAGEKPITELVGSPPLLETLRERLSAQTSSSDTRPPTLVKAGSEAIRIDAERWPEAFVQVDINDRVPPGYPALDVYCYDFNNQLRPDLAEKQVEIEAEGVGGRRIKVTALFRLDQPDLYARGVRFPLAARLDRPYRYRVTEVDLDGESVDSPWRQRNSWTELLDVTSAARPAVTKLPVEEP